MPNSSPQTIHRCPHCGIEISDSILKCPACNKLVHAAALNRLAAEADQATRQGRLVKAVEHWEEALSLIPNSAPQYDQIQQRIQDLSDGPSKPAERADQKKDHKGAKNAAAAAGALALVAWKFKFVFAFILTKGKLLLLGLTKTGTLFSMLAAVGVYWTLWGWKFALGFVISIYIHEMGHVAALRRFGIRADAPMFIPGLGAFVRMRQHPKTAHEDAIVGLAGPWWGLGAAVVAYAIGLVFDSGLFLAIAKFSAWVNLFNLLPFWQLDGGRGFKALTKQHRIFAAAAILGVWFFTAEGLLFLLLIGAVAQVFTKAPDEPDLPVLVQYAFLVAALGWLSTIPVPS